MTRRVRVAIAIVAALAGGAAADEVSGGSVRGAARPGTSEAGIFLGGFISNYFHQFYDPDVMPSREELDRLSPLFGARYAMFPLPILGVEVEGTLITATTKQSHDAAQIWGLRGQVLLQRPARVTPFVGLGVGLSYVSSDDRVLGSDLDVPIHLGAGVRVFATPALVVRVDARFLRGPSQQAPYTLNASYGELTFGLSFNPSWRTGRRP